ncbi:MAG: YqgE/AlgH family protein [Flavobacteriales bacterium]|nr:YqgE/AlgH family protein [Flavobacteriales bacterium]
MLLNPLDYKLKDLNKLKPGKGRLLLAEPFMEDPYFKRSVVLLTENNQKEGAFGFILNKVLDVTVNDVIKDFPDFYAPVYMGGPVQTDSLFYMHSQGEFIENSVKISENLYWSGNYEQLKQMIADQQIFPNEVKFFIGYSGWDFEQLKGEIEQESWIIAKNDYTTIQELNDDNLWHNMLQRMGGKFAQLSNFPENPSLN